ncbi:glycine betaine/proline transport system substrate-binding protein [Limimonas halophila]|uniref:Glycine betaine/proline transport system substrate-binding protein n=1 Tax=Limimonas halophila TaxID=1082479 RepID=A0A1G7PTP6_9PROT|nr:ABC transporter substrate-binding protein [Limimonas halophila]SDF89697.1 glycine betaine/proline transport system substrate-binding protein [Limimonas halophila]
MKLRKTLAVAAVGLLATTGVASAQDNGNDACKTVRLEQVNWTGVTAKTETLAWVLQQLGYETDIITASVPIMFQSLARNERDAFLGLWLPTQRGMIEKYMKKGEIDIIGVNLDGAKYTVGVPEYVYESGIKSFKDLAENKEKFDGKIYGIEAGNDGNKIIKQMIKDDAYGLGDWELVPSSSAGMLAQVGRMVKNEKPIAHLAWEPHPMNLKYNTRYLSGGEEYWGPNKGGATVYTMTRKGYAWDCPNVGQLLENFTFTLNEQNKMGDYVLNKDMDYAEAGKELIRNNPKILERWFKQGGKYTTTGVTTRSGDGDPVAVIKDALGMSG